MNKKNCYSFINLVALLFRLGSRSIYRERTSVRFRRESSHRATVVIKGTTNGTTTDLDGNYTIEVAPGQELEFSYVGMQPSVVKVSDRKWLT